MIFDPNIELTEFEACWILDLESRLGALQFDVCPPRPARRVRPNLDDIRKMNEERRAKEEEERQEKLRRDAARVYPPYYMSLIPFRVVFK